MSYSSSGGGLNLIRRLFQTVSELKAYICSQYVEKEHTLAEKRWNLLCYTPKPHSHALNDVIMHKTHYTKGNFSFPQSKVLSHKIERKYGETSIFAWKTDVLFSDPFPKKRSDHESQKSGFRFDLKNPFEVWIFWIHDPFLDFSNKTQNPFSRFRIQESGFGFSPKNAPLDNLDMSITKTKEPLQI